MEPINIAKKSHLNKLSDEKGIFKIVAIDHRAVYVNDMKRFGASNPSTEDIIQSKMRLIRLLKEKASSFLLDPLYSANQAIENKALGDKGLLIGIEGNDYSSTEFKDDYLTDLIDVETIAKIGGDCVKVFFYYYFNDIINEKQFALLRKISAKCKKFDLPLLLEPIIAQQFDNRDIMEKISLNKQMLDELSVLDVDIFKIMFPTDTDIFAMEECIAQCKDVTSSLKAPFITLTSGVTEDIFFKQLEIISKAGGSGFAVGRTLWRGCIYGKDEDIKDNIEKMNKSFDKMSDIASNYGKDWKTILK